MNFHRDPAKDIKIRGELWRNGVWFDDIAGAIDWWDLIEIINHHNQVLYPEQHIMIVSINWYLYNVPCYIDGDDCRMITIYPSRKSTKKYL